MSFLTKLRPVLPQKLKGGRIEGIWNYFANIASDYRIAIMELGKDMTDRPIKSGIYITLLTSIAVMMKTRPSEMDFKDALTESSLDLMLLSDLIRNRKSESHVNNLNQLMQNNRLNYMNLGVCTIVYATKFGSHIGLYEARCKYAKTHWTEFHKTIVDIGFLGRWIYLTKAMKDFDINPNEWLENGKPNPEFLTIQQRNLIYQYAGMMPKK